MGVLDFQRFMPTARWQPGQPITPEQWQSPAFWQTGGGPAGPGTFSTPVQPDGAPQQEPPPPKPENAPGNTPISRPPIMTSVGGLGMQTRIDPPTSPLTPVTPPTQTLPAPTGRKDDVVPAYGPGASQPSVTQAPVTPIEPAFNPDTREAVRKATPPAGTPAVAAGNDWDRIAKMMKDPKFGPAIAALAKIGGGGKGPAPPAPWRSTLQGGNPGFHQPNAGSAGQMMEGLLKPKPGWTRKRKERTDDPFQHEQDMYDFRRLRGKG